MQIREATIEDAEILEALERECFSDPWSLAVFKSCFLSNNIRILLAEEKDGEETSLQGYVIYFQVLDEGNIDNLAVRKDARKKGLGRMLLREALRQMKEAGVMKTFLEVRASNEPARKLYESENFKVYGTRKDYYQNPREDAILYVWEGEQ